MLLADLVATSTDVAATRSRRAKVAAVAACLRAMDAAELPVGAALLAGEPRQDRLEVGWAAVREVEAPSAASPSLTLTEVDAALETIAGMSGTGSRGARMDALRNLLGRATEDEQDFLRRLLLRELRQGAQTGILVQGIAEAASLPEDEVRRALMLSGDPGEVAHAALVVGPEAVRGFRLQLFRPILPMLAQTAPDAASAVTMLGSAAVEHKLDGARIQVHARDGEVRVYTRNLNDVTERLPEVVEAVRGFRAGSLVLDGEAISFDEGGRPRPFQATMARFGTQLESGAGLSVSTGVALTAVFFDLLHRDGQDLLDLPTRDRMAALADAVPDAHRIPRITVDDGETATEFLRAALADGHEGVMVKDLDAPYEAGQRGAAWRKVKPVHTLDLVVLAAEWGSGRRRGWLSNLHLGARAPDHGTGFVMLGKTFKGMTDEMLAWQTERLQELETRRTRNTVFVRPELVVEIAIDGVQTSTRYPGGVALRFARVKGYRPDKDPADADTLETVKAIHRGEVVPEV